MKLPKILTALMLVCAVALPALAQSAQLPPLAAVKDGQLIVHSAAGDAPVPLDDYTDATSLVWSPDGQRLLFVAYDPKQTPTLLLTNMFGDVARTVASNLSAGFPGTFADANTVLYARDRAGNPQPSGDWLVDIYRTGLTEGAEPELVGSFASQVGCGGGSPLPADWQYWQEIGIGASLLILQQTPTGIVHSTSCGGAGTALLDTSTGEDKPIGDNLSRVSVSPDGAHLAGVEVSFDRKTNQEQRRLITADLSTLTVTPVKTAALPDQTAWSADGQTLFYTSREMTGPIPLSSEQAQSFTRLTGLDAGIGLWRASLHRVGVDGAQDETIAQLDAYAIARLGVAPDGKSVYFSAVSNMDKWAAGIADLTIDPANSDQQAAAVPVTLYRLDLSGGQPVSLADDLHGFTLNR